MKIFLVEDEWIHAEDIRISIENLGFEWLGYSSEGFDAINKINELQPDVILVDMMLHGSYSGISIAKHINKEIKKPFIFITSIIDDAVIEEGLSTNPLAYLTKPVNEGDLKAALFKLKTSNKISEHKLYDVNDTADQLLVRIGKNLKPIFKKNISYIETAQKNYCKIHSLENDIFVVKKSLSALSDFLDSKYFCRVHKEYIINLQAITKVDEQEHLVYVGTTPIPIGNNYRKEFLENFNVL
jgi:DNA-binding LytR/AlgR family response regulator